MVSPNKTTTTKCDGGEEKRNKNEEDKHTIKHPKCKRHTMKFISIWNPSRDA